MQQQTEYPIFREYDLETLVSKLDYSIYTLLQFKERRREPPARFRQLAVAVLGRTEQELFGEMKK